MKALLALVFSVFALTMLSGHFKAPGPLTKGKPIIAEFTVISEALADEPGPAALPSPAPTAQADGIDKASGFLEKMNSALESNKEMVLSILGFLGSLLFMKLFPNSKAGPIVGKLHAGWDKIFNLLPAAGKLIGLLLEFAYALVKSDGIGGKK